MSVKRHHPFSMKSVFCLFHNPTFRTFYEIHDILDFFTHRNLIDNLLDSILNTEITLIDQPVSIGNMTKDSFPTYCDAVTERLHSLHDRQQDCRT